MWLREINHVMFFCFFLFLAKGMHTQQITIGEIITKVQHKFVEIISSTKAEEREGHQRITY